MRDSSHEFLAGSLRSGKRRFAQAPEQLFRLLLRPDLCILGGIPAGCPDRLRPPGWSLRERRSAPSSCVVALREDIHSTLRVPGSAPGPDFLDPAQQQSTASHTPATNATSMVTETKCKRTFVQCFHATVFHAGHGAKSNSPRLVIRPRAAYTRLAFSRRHRASCAELPLHTRDENLSGNRAAAVAEHSGAETHRDSQHLAAGDFDNPFARRSARRGSPFAALR